jgi:HK97 family phage major capsid protein
VTEGYDFVAGDGVNKSRGFTTHDLAATADATRPWTVIEKLHAGSTSAITIDNLIDLKGKLAPRYRKNAAWVMHPDTETAIRKLKAVTSGDYYWQQRSRQASPTRSWACRASST